MRPPIRKICVVVPAHDEEEVIGRCLESICHAAQTVSLPVSIMVVLDDCGDDSEEICRSFPVDLCTVTARSVGFARRVGIAKLLSGATEIDTIWIANTDADTVVPPTWLRDQLALASSGVDAVVGTVRLSDEETHIGRDFNAAYATGIDAGEEHSHVHGANLGFRASAYLQAGGFPPLALHEDRLLVRSLESCGASVVRSRRVTVETSPRLVGRCEGGFATALRQLSMAS